MTEEEARDYVRARCSPESFARLEAFADRLRVEAARQNLVSRSSLDVLWTRHFADSAQLLDLLPSIPQHDAPLLDVGSGAGFPGMVLAIMRPDLRCVLVEPRRLRIDWLNALAEDLAPNVRVEGGQIERISRFPAYAITARACAPLVRFVGLLTPFSTSDTVWLLPKGRSAQKEVSELPASVSAMFHVKQSVTDPEAGVIVGKGKVAFP